MAFNRTKERWESIPKGLSYLFILLTAMGLGYLFGYIVGGLKNSDHKTHTEDVYQPPGTI
jgi:hypothetical protein